MLPPSAVIAVDDDKSHLDAIVKALRKLDISCLPILVTGSSPNIAKPLTGVRICFFDINYLPSELSPTEMFEMAATVLLKVIAPDNGPYALITWSSKSDAHDELMKYFSDNVSALMPPAVSACLAKEKFLAAGKKRKAKGKKRPSSELLHTAIKKTISANAQVAALLTWQGSATRAAGEVLESALALVDRAARFSGNSGPSLEQTLTHLAYASVGSKNVAPDRRRAMNEALTPLLYDRMIHLVPKDEEKAAWKAALPLAADLPKLPPEHQARLNTLCNIAFPSAGLTMPGDRGSVISLKSDTIKPLLRGTGLSEQSVRDEYVKFVAAKKVTEATATDLEECAKCRWVLVGMRAVCDQAHLRGVLRPLALALEVPMSISEAEKGAGFRVREHGAYLVTPIFSLPGASGKQEGRALIFNWHWVTALGDRILKRATVNYCLRELLIQQVSNAYSSYRARPGIISVGRPPLSMA